MQLSGWASYQVCCDGGIAQRPGAKLEYNLPARHFDLLGLHPAARIGPGLEDGDLALREFPRHKVRAREAGHAAAEHGDALRIRRGSGRVPVSHTSCREGREQRARGDVPQR
jgi:hypothetical protein